MAEFIGPSTGSLGPADRAAGSYNGTAFYGANWQETTVTLEIGTISVGATLTAKVQESSDGLAGWADIPGAAFATVYEDQGGQNFDGLILATTKRLPYYRGVIDIAGGTVGCSMPFRPSRGVVPTSTPQWRVE